MPIVTRGVTLGNVRKNRCSVTAIVAAKLQNTSVAGYVTLGNFSCNLRRDKIATQVARNVAWCNTALYKVGI